MSRLLRERARPARVREHPSAPWFAVAAVCVGSFMGQLDASIVTLIFPALQHEFGAPLAAVQWVAVAYLLALVALLAGAGRLADVAGRKLVYLYGFALFTAASAACGFAPSLPVLVVCRVAQAAGAAMLQANSVALVVAGVPRQRTRAALGIQAAAQSLGLAVGPLVGGVLVGVAGWRWVFWLNVPVGLVAVVAGRYLLPRTRERAGGGAFDVAGLVLLACTTSGLLLSVSAVSGLDWPPWAAVALVATAVTSAVLLRHREGRAAAPLLNPTLLGGAAVARGLAGALFGYLVLFGPLVLIPQVLIAAGLSEPHAGLVLSALPAGFAVTALAGDHLLPRRWDNRRRCLAGALTAAAAAGGAAIAPTTLGPLAAFLAVLGAGLGMFVPANNAAVMAAVPARMSATAGGLINMARGVGTALGIAGVTLALYSAHGPGPAGARVALVGLVGAALAAALTMQAPSRPDATAQSRRESRDDRDRR
ncbi:MFS transporter [Sphaerisporangium melleum]|uniref:MFS transporter n=1 Tax=Sphaerisporangium melleum TaxID=321316 RepID=A0A917R7Y7_9ACTN|nr:MFS transporter [Sphaerisporangium melleum]GGK94050.1 MFS transporter [Sphaerisporangium melleum]GII73348.1 MFS transporter [Sphaerisporangium melleum]